MSRNWSLPVIHWPAWLVFFVVLGLLVWLNLGASQLAYNEPSGPTSNKGGVRVGFPLICWDGGNEFSVSIAPNGRMKLTVQEYGGALWPQLATNLACGLALLGLLCGLSEWGWRHWRKPDLSRREPEPLIHPLTFLLALSLGAGLVMLNLKLELHPREPVAEIDTPRPAADEAQMDLWHHRPGEELYRQTMGWPLTMFEQTHPDLKRSGVDAHNLAFNFAYLRVTPDIRWRNGHWFEHRLTLNLLLGSLLIAGTSFALERLYFKKVNVPAACQAES